MTLRVAFALLALLVAGTARAASPWDCRALNFQKVSPRLIFVELWCVDTSAASNDPCRELRLTKKFRFAPGMTNAEKRAQMRDEARATLKALIRARERARDPQTGDPLYCTLTDNDANTAGVTSDDPNP